jgi:mono/diheme cytochrome c family protein
LAVVRRAVVLALFALAVAGCGGGKEEAAKPETVSGTPPVASTEGAPTPGGDPVAGKQIFVKEGCGSCHTLKDAGTNGTVGPNLDEAKPDLDLAIERVTNGRSPMPSFKGKLTEKQINDVAAYVVDATTG